MIILAWPWALAALPLPLLARFLPAVGPGSGAALRLPSLQAEGALDLADVPRHRRLGLMLAWIAWALLVLATARPEWLGDPVTLPLAGRDLMLAVDVSGSMENEDYLLGGRPANRLDVVKSVAGPFIERRQGDRLGLILFGSRAYLQTPLTHDRATVQAMLTESVIGLAGRETAVGDAIGLAVKRLRDREDDNRVLITPAGMCKGRLETDDLLIVDMNGKALYDKLKALNPSLKVLYMSGYTADVIAHREVLDEEHISKHPPSLKFQLFLYYLVLFYGPVFLVDSYDDGQGYGSRRSADHDPRQHEDVGKGIGVDVSFFGCLRPEYGRGLRLQAPARQYVPAHVPQRYYPEEESRLEYASRELATSLLSL